MCVSVQFLCEVLSFVCISLYLLHMLDHLGCEMIHLACFVRCVLAFASPSPPNDLLNHSWTHAQTLNGTTLHSEEILI